MAKNSNDCFACGAWVFSSKVVKSGTEWWKCSSCGSLGQVPPPSQGSIEKIYTDYVSFKQASLPGYLRSETQELYVRSLQLTMADLSIDSSFFDEVDLLDVGCGTGQFLELAASFGARSALGIDLSESCVSECQKKGLEAKRVDLFEASGSFNLITCFHVLEHVVDPRSSLRHIVSLLQPSGMIWIETPIVSRFALARGARWRYLYPNEHPSLFSRKGLVGLADSIGLEIVAETSFGSGFEPSEFSVEDKSALDTLAKELDEGDTLSILMKKVA